MKLRHISLVLIFLTIFAGCSDTEIVKKPEDKLTYGVEEKIKLTPDRIETIAGKEFSIVISSKPAMGYAWKSDYDHDYIKWVKTGYGTVEQAKILGVASLEILTYKALKSGEINLTLNYKLPWEKKPIDTKVYKIIIK